MNKAHEKNSRKLSISVASVILMLLVIFIHCSSEAVEGYSTDSLHFMITQSAHRLSSFAVQGFIFLSGLKLFLPRSSETSGASESRSINYGRFYLSRIKRVVLPYIAAFSLYYLYLWHIGCIEPSLRHYFGELTGGGLVGHFYFIAVICQFYLLMPLWQKVSRCSALPTLLISLLLMIILKSAIPELLSLIGISFPYTGRLLTTYLFYFIAGIFCGKHYAEFVTWVQKSARSIVILFFTTAAVTCASILSIKRHIYYPSWAETAHTLYCTAGILLLLLLSLKAEQALSHKPRLTALVSAADRSSYYVYLIHPILIYLCNGCLTALGITSLTARLMIRLLSVSILTPVICILLCECFRRLKPLHPLRPD